MKRENMRKALVAGGLLVFAGVTSAGAQTAPPNPVEPMAKAKAVFERACSVCHGLERPLSKTYDQPKWEGTVERMRGNGAQVSDEERAMIVTFLLTKNTFEAKCSACHGIDRPLGKSKSAADWLATVQRMSGKKPGHLTEAEVADIAAYLSLARPEQK